MDRRPDLRRRHLAAAGLGAAALLAAPADAADGKGKAKGRRGQPWLSVEEFGATGGKADQWEAFQRWADALGKAKGGAVGLIPAGRPYRLSRTVGFAGNDITIFAYGANLVSDMDEGPLVDLNTEARDGPASASIRWYGGRFTGPKRENRATGIRLRAITRGEVAGVFGTQFGHAFITLNIRDGFYLRDVHGWKNGRHVLVEAREPVSQRPQALSIEDFGFSKHDIAGIAFEGNVNAVSIRNGYFIGTDAIVVEPSDMPKRDLRNLNVSECTFEQGEEDAFYIRVSAGKRFDALMVENCDFAHTYCKVLKADHVRCLGFRGNFVVSEKPGWLELGEGCRGVEIGAITWRLDTAAPARLACPRDEVRCWPGSLTPANTLLFDRSVGQGGTRLDPAATLGLPSSAVPPRAYWIRLRAEGRGIERGTVSLGADGAARTVYLDGLDGVLSETLCVPADRDGTLLLRASAGPTASVRLTLEVESALY